MTKAEYEEKKQELETRHHIAVQFLQKGYEAQLRTLESEWGQAPEAPLPDLAAHLGEAGVAASPELPPWTYLSGGLLESVRQAVDQLPVEFKKEDIIRLLGATPERSSLHRAIDTLLRERKIRIHLRGAGRVPNVYRKMMGDTPESP